MQALWRNVRTRLQMIREKAISEQRKAESIDVVTWGGSSRSNKEGSVMGLE